MAEPSDFAVTPIDMICGVWIALDEATAENGCMHVLPGDHLKGPRKHYHDRDCEIMPDRRRAVQFHYRAAHTTSVPRDEYDRIFCEADGTPASCAAA